MFLIGTVLDWLKPRPDVTLTSQLAPQGIIERSGPGGEPDLPPPDGNGWAIEEWASPYMAMVAHVVFRPDVTLTPQLAPERIIERLGPGGEAPGMTLISGLAPQGIIERVGPGGEAPPVSPQTDLGAKPEFGEWLKKNQILVVVVFVALVVLFFFLKKGRR